ncbi:hypothetical protein HY621_02300 [Candidatus Uhrbacteria bacterium]|nr:hypothetical protein [Candidatus Uhrbacteria bacterium]
MKRQNLYAAMFAAGTFAVGCNSLSDLGNFLAPRAVGTAWVAGTPEPTGTPVIVPQTYFPAPAPVYNNRTSTPTPNPSASASPATPTPTPTLKPTPFTESDAYIPDIRDIINWDFNKFTLLISKEKPGKVTVYLYEYAATGFKRHDPEKLTITWGDGLTTHPVYNETKIAHVIGVIHIYENPDILGRKICIDAAGTKYIRRVCGTVLKANFTDELSIGDFIDTLSPVATQ